MKLILEFDDLNPKGEVNCLFEIKNLINLFPKIKLTFFTSALYMGTPLYSNKAWCEEISRYIQNNNIRLAVHGLVHHPIEEFKWKNKNDTLLALNEAESIFKTSELDFIKVFRGPHWGINEETYEALIELKYKAVYNHESYKALGDKYEKDIKNIYYNWNLKDSFDENLSNGVIVAHGHTHNVCGNGIQETFSKIVDFINERNPNFLFADEI